MAPNDSPSQPISGARDTIIVLGDHSDVGAEEEVDSVEVLSNDNESVPDDDPFEEVSQATKRKATLSAPKTPTAKKRRGKLKASWPFDRHAGVEEITKRYMEILLLCKEEGLLNSTSSGRHIWDKSWNPVRDKLLSIFSCEYPKLKWNKLNFQHRYNIERRRYSLFITFLREPGASYNEATGMVTGTKATFKGFISQYPDGWWLPHIPLGNYGVYKEVFWREKPLGLRLYTCSTDEITDSEEDTTDSEEDDTAESEEATTVP